MTRRAVQWGVCTEDYVDVRRVNLSTHPLAPLLSFPHNRFFVCVYYNQTNKSKKTMALLQSLRDFVANNSRLIQISIVVLALSTPSSSLHRRFAKSFRAVATLAFCILVAAVLIPYALVRLAITQLERVFHPNIKLKDAMAESDTYAEWHEKARKLDLYEGRDIWQSNSPTANSIHHNWELVTDLINNLVQAREDDDPMMALVAIEQSSARNVGGILSKGLYSRTNTGEPKDIVMKLVTEFEKTLDYLIDRSLGSVPDEPLSVSQRARQLRRSYHIGLGIRASIVGDKVRVSCRVCRVFVCGLLINSKLYLLFLSL